MSSTIGTIFGEIQLKEPSELDNSNLVEEFSGQFQTDWTIPEAYMCVLLSAVYADGVDTPEEIDYVRSLARRCQTLKGRDSNELAKINVTVTERMQSRPDALGEACRTLPREMHMTLFAHCIDIVLADGELAHPEEDFLNLVMEKFRLRPEDAKQIMQVIFMKNRY